MPELHPDQFFHGSPSGDLRGGHYGLHLGTERAAHDALNARIGEPAEGTWDGTRIYGQTKLKGNYGVSMSTGERDTSKDRYPSPEGRRASYSDGSNVALDSIPEVTSYRLTGRLTNTPDTPHQDSHANGYMTAQKKRGRAKSGYFYRNVSEDEGSISVVVPDGSHVERVDKSPKQMRMF